jgi:SAM-dependent methyltransferase
MLGLERGPHLTRYTMYRRLSEVGPQLPKHRGDALAISHSTHLLPLLGIEATQVTEANYPQYRLTELPFEANRFDFVVSDEVLEHVEGDPIQAVEESRRVLRTGGVAVHTTVFNYPIHGSPNDYWRYTPEALRFLCKNFTEIVECGGWGSFDAWRWARRGLQFEPVPHATWHPFHKVATRNDPAWPIVTWIIAVK